MSFDEDAEFQHWIQRARDVPILEVAEALGARLKRQGAEMVGPCPACGGEDRFAVKASEGVFVCRGAAGGDGLAMAMHVRGIDFVAACEFVLDEPPPRSDPSAPAQPIDDEAARERREEHKAKEQAQESATEAKRRAARERSATIFNAARPIDGTHADAYLRNRGIVAAADILADLRFVPALEYRGHVEGADEEEALGEFPCMVAAIRDATGVLIGIHRTYLDPKAPIKLKPPGDPRRNLAKKVYGQQAGGMIRLGPARASMATGEGIETTLAWYLMGRGPDDVCVAAAINLGNMAGGSTGSIAHPTIRKRTIPNGNPDMARPGMGIPDAVTDLILLGDGDSDPANTYAHLLTAARRHLALGRAVSIDFAPTGLDWNDVLQATAAGAAA